MPLHGHLRRLPAKSRVGHNIPRPSRITQVLMADVVSWLADMFAKWKRFPHGHLPPKRRDLHSSKSSFDCCFRVCFLSIPFALPGLYTKMVHPALVGRTWTCNSDARVVPTITQRFYWVHQSPPCWSFRGSVPAATTPTSSYQPSSINFHY